MVSAFIINQQEDWDYNSLLSKYDYVTPYHLDVPFEIDNKLVRECAESIDSFFYLS